jgi:hypothetical protein
MSFSIRGAEGRERAKIIASVVSGPSGVVVSLDVTEEAVGGYAPLSPRAILIPTSEVIESVAEDVEGVAERQNIFSK